MIRVFSMYELWVVYADGESRKYMTSASVDVVKEQGKRLISQGRCSDWHVMEKRETTTVSFHAVAASRDEES